MIIRKSKRPIYYCLFGLDDSIGGALLGGVMDIAGGIFSADMQNSATEAMQMRNIAWEKEQLQNKHQWEVEDLRKAGLNPILSAPNASSAVSAGSPQGASPNIQLSKTLEALSNSALMRKETELKQFALDTERIKADAAMIEAKQKEFLTPSAQALNQTQADLNITNIWRMSKLVPLEEAYAKANIDKTKQDMLNSIVQVQALVRYYDAQGRAAIMMGSAAQSQAAAAHRNAAANEIIAEVARENGVSERALKDALAGKASEETKEAAARVEQVLAQNKSLDWQLKKDMFHNPAVVQGSFAGTGLAGFGEMLRNGIGGSIGFSIRP